jgi:hypothetical protein
MQRYQIEIKQSQSATIIVDAVDEYQAQSLAENLIEQNNISYDELDTRIVSVKEI